MRHQRPRCLFSWCRGAICTFNLGKLMMQWVLIVMPLSVNMRQCMQAAAAHGDQLRGTCFVSVGLVHDGSPRYEPQLTIVGLFPSDIPFTCPCFQCSSHAASDSGRNCYNSSWQICCGLTLWTPPNRAWLAFEYHRRTAFNGLLSSKS